jgi:predicted ATPase/DNA-binding CsgD family transcriptional regulator
VGVAQVTHGGALGRVHGVTPAMTSFVGRVGEVGEVAGLLAEYRLVTVTGPGGVGKSRLATEVARQVAERFADGVWRVDLASVREPALVQAAVAAAVGLRQAPGASIRDSLTAVLGRRQLLLVLDNCEHVLAAAAELCGWLLPAADDVRVLATSREPVAVAGEARLRLGPLGLPGADDQAGALASAAVVLFADRARRVDPHFTLDGGSGPAVARLVRRLDGMPLAIELAAARVEALGVTQLLGRLDDRFRLLVGTDRMAAARHGSLAAAVEWSYQLLDGQEQRVFRRLAVFPGPFVLEAAEAVAGDAAATALLHLVDCSLVVPPGDGPDGRARYLMLETLRAYGAERLAQAGETAEAAAALAGYALGVAEQASAGLESSDAELPAALWLDAEDATMHQVLAWALEHDTATALRLAIALAPWWILRGRPAAGYALLAAAAGHATGGSDGWCSAQLELGNLVRVPGGARGLEHFTAARDVLAPRGPSPMLVRALNGRAACLANSDHIPEAADDARRALAMAREIGYPAGEAEALYCLAGTADYAGDHQASLAWAWQARRIDPAGIPAVMARRCSYALIVALIEAGDTDTARRMCIEAMAAAERAGDRRHLADCLSEMAELDVRAGRVAEATAWLREALGLSMRLDADLLVTDLLDLCGSLCAQTQRWGDALSLWAAASASLNRIGAPDLPGDVQHRQEPMGRARRALGPAGTLAAEQRGAAMTLATAAEFAVMLLTAEPGEPQPALGLPRLSARERELVTLVAQGCTDAQIAGQLVISVRTVRSHLDRIRDKTGCRRRADLTRLALQAGLV